MRKRKHEEHENLERWLISYADFITLLFAFFVVMYSISAINEGRLRAVAEAISSAFNPFIAMSTSNIRLTTEQSATEAIKVEMDLYVKVVAEIKALDAMDRIHVSKEKRGVVIRIADKLAFEAGRADIVPEFRPTLDKLAIFLRGVPNRIQIEGHTDNIPIKTVAYPSNWELSAARAVSIMRYLTEQRSLDPARFSVSGYGEFRPLASNDTLDGRAKNRRVELILLPGTDNNQQAEVVGPDDVAPSAGAPPSTEVGQPRTADPASASGPAVEPLSRP